MVRNSTVHKWQHYCSNLVTAKLTNPQKQTPTFFSIVSFSSIQQTNKSVKGSFSRDENINTPQCQSQKNTDRRPETENGNVAVHEVFSFL
jgi:hypothetical protein